MGAVVIETQAEFEKEIKALSTLIADNKEEIKYLRTEASTLKIELALTRQQLEQMRDDHKYITNGLSRFLWLIGGGLTAGILTWIMKGGLER